MKKLLRWAIYLLLLLIALVVVAIFSFNPFVKSLAEHRLRTETGMETEIGAFKLGLRDRTVHVRDLKLKNTAEFGGGTFIHLPEIYLELNTDAARSNVLHFHKVRVNLAELHVIENKEGKKNTDVFTLKKQKEGSGTNGPSQQVAFGGIDHLEVVLGKASYRSERFPKQNYERELGVDRVFENVQTEKDLQAVGVLIIGQIGMSALLEKFAGTGEKPVKAPVTNVHGEASSLLPETTGTR